MINMENIQSNNRGQLIIIAGVVISLGILILAVVVNGVVLTSELSDRPIEPEVSESNEIETTMHNEYNELIVRSNDDFQYQTNDLIADIDRITESLQLLNAEQRSVMYSSQIDSTVEGEMFFNEDSDDIDEIDILTEEIRRFHIESQNYRGNPVNEDNEDEIRDSFTVKIESELFNLDENEYEEGTGVITGSETGNQKFEDNVEAVNAEVTDGIVSSLNEDIDIIGSDIENGGVYAPEGELIIISSDITGDVGGFGGITVDSSTIEGDVISDDEINIEGGSTIEGDVISLDEINIEDGSTIEGNVIALDEINIEDGSIIEGDVISGDEIDVDNGQVNGETIENKENIEQSRGVVDEWYVYIYDNEDGENSVAIDDNGEIDIVYTENADGIDISITTGGINEKSNLFNYPFEDEEHSIEFENTNLIDGFYTGVVPDGSEIRSANSVNGDVLYSTTINVEYKTQQVAHLNDVTIAPCDIRGTSCKYGVVDQ